jgi:hypothetical protein
MPQKNSKKTKKEKMTKKFWSGYFGAFFSLKQNVEAKINEFQKIKDAKNNTANQVYMESIILDMAKILGVSRSDQTGIESIKNHLQSGKFFQFKNQIEKIDKKYKSVKSKIKQNRNRIISHIDFHKKPYYGLKFSQAEVNRIYDVPENLIAIVYGDEEKYKSVKAQAEKQLVSNQKRNQRYAPIDLDKDVPLFKSIIDELTKIFNEINLFVNNPKRYKELYMTNNDSKIADSK